MSTVGTRSNKLSAVLAYENLPHYGHCRATVTVTTATGMDIGAVLQRTISAGTITPGAVVGTGNGTVGTTSVANSPALQLGTYTLRFTAATTFNIIDPQGDVVGTGSTGVAVANVQGLTFTVTAGGTAFVLNDSIPLVVAGTTKYTWVANANVATLADDVVVLIDVYKDPVNLVAGDYSLAVLTRGAAAIVGAGLQYADTVSAANQAIVQAKLLAKGIQTRTQV